MTVDFEEVLSLLRSHLKLDRDRALDQLREGLQGLQEGENDIENLRTKILACVEATTSWESRHGGLLGAKVMIASKHGDKRFIEEMRVHAVRLIHDEEARVRQAAVAMNSNGEGHESGDCKGRMEKWKLLWGAAGQTLRKQGKWL